MLVRLGLAAALVLTLTACAGDDAAPKEPVDEASPVIPDSPGDGGETAEKPAGAGQAGAAAEAGAKPAAKVEAVPAAPGERTVATGALNVRSGASMTSSVVRVLKGGERVKPVSCEKGWCKLAEGEFVGEKNLK